MSLGKSFWGMGAVFFFMGSFLYAQEETAVPPGLERRPPIPPKLVERKREGSYFTGLPLLNFDPNTGIGYGVRVYYYDNGERKDPFFRYAPYFHQVYAQFFQTTRGRSYHIISWDAPYIGHSLFRIRASVVYDRNIALQFFGVGEETLNPLRSPVDGKEYAKYSDYQAKNVEISNGTTYAWYNLYDLEQPTLQVYIDRLFFGGVVRILGGVRASRVQVRDYTGKKVPAEKGEEAIQKKTLLKEYEEQGKLVGINGGWHNLLKFALVYDTRDFEPDPTQGVVLDLNGEFSFRGIGSDFSYSRYSSSLQIYFTPFSFPLTFALRGLYAWYTGNPPFFTLSEIPLSGGNITGLGGRQTLRGYKANRFVGNVYALGNVEARWKFFSFSFFLGDFDVMLVPFVDAGRIFDEVERTSLKDWKINYGVGLRFAWNQATIILLPDFAVSSEDTNLYINFNHIF